MRERQTDRQTDRQRQRQSKTVGLSDRTPKQLTIHLERPTNSNLKTLLLRGAPSPVTAKEAGLQGDVRVGRAGHQQGTLLNGEIIPC